MKKIVLIGIFDEIIELCQRKNLNIECGIDPLVKDEKYNFKVYDAEESFLDLYKGKLGDYEYLLIPDSPKVRERLKNKLDKNIFLKNYKTIIDSNVFLSESAKIGRGTIILNGSLVSSNTKIGNFVKMNFFARVHHDSIIDDYCTLAPGATILGNVYVGKGVYIGANSTILPGIKIGKNAIVGAGAVVTKSVEDNRTVVGVPARELRRDKEVN